MFSIQDQGLDGVYGWGSDRSLFGVEMPVRAGNCTWRLPSSCAARCFGLLCCVRLPLILRRRFWLCKPHCPVRLRPSVIRLARSWSTGLADCTGGLAGARRLTLPCRRSRFPGQALLKRLKLGLQGMPAVASIRLKAQVADEISC